MYSHAIALTSVYIGQLYQPVRITPEVGLDSEVTGQEEVMAECQHGPQVCTPWVTHAFVCCWGLRCASSSEKMARMGCRDPDLLTLYAKGTAASPQ